jgi:hypothetical protein
MKSSQLSQKSKIQLNINHKLEMKKLRCHISISIHMMELKSHHSLKAMSVVEIGDIQILIKNIQQMLLMKINLMIIFKERDKCLISISLHQVILINLLHYWYKLILDKERILEKIIYQISRNHSRIQYHQI